MKKNLGRLSILLMLLQNILFAQQLASYQLFANKDKAHVKEPIKITFVAQQQDRTNVMIFSLTPKPSPDYTIELLTSKIDDESHHHTKMTYKYLLFPLVAKKITVDFTFVVKTASDKGVAHSYVEDHDDSKGIEFDVTTLATKPLIIPVEALEHKVDLVGDYTLTEKIDKTAIDQYGSVNLIYTLQGTGYKTKADLLTPFDPDVTLFADTDHFSEKLSDKGYKSTRHYTYSLSATHNFTIPSLNLRAFSPTTGKYYSLTQPSHTINVTKIKEQTLLDDEESPQEKPMIDYAQIKQFAVYMIVFIFGFVLAKLSEYRYIFKQKRSVTEDIKQSKTPMELIHVLLNNYANYDMHEHITALEALQYHNGDKSFKQIKRAVLASLK